MDPNLMKIKEHNMRLIRRGKIALPIIHAKSYLFHILGEENREDIEAELGEFVGYIKTLIPNPPEARRKPPYRGKKTIRNRR